MKRSVLPLTIRCLLCLILIFATTTVYSQTEKVENRYSASRFKDFHNRNQIDSIYNLFSADMQSALPLDKAKPFLSELKTQAGAVIRMEFKKYEGPYASYKTTFERGTFAVNIALDAAHKINGFFVKPYEDEADQGGADKNK